MSASAIYLSQHDFSKSQASCLLHHSHVTQPIYVPSFHNKLQLMGPNYNVYEQFLNEVVEKRRRLQPKVREHRSKGDTAWIAYDTLYVNGRPVRE